MRTWSALLVTASVLLAACASGPADVAPEEDGDVESSSEALSLTTADAVSRADEWATAKLKYCQAPNGARDYDSACSTYCSRTKNAKWDPYRSDCSGLVSWAWGLPAPGRVTGQFAPFQKDITKVIDAKDLAPGDAVNNADHIMIFKKWITKPTNAVFIEEPGCSSSLPYAHETTSVVSVNGSTIHINAHGTNFTAIRYSALKTPTKPPAPPTAAPTATADVPDDTAPAAAPAPTEAAPVPAAVIGTTDLEAPPSESSGCAQTGSSSTSTSGDVALAVAGVILLATRRRRARA